MKSLNGLIIGVGTALAVGFVAFGIFGSGVQAVDEINKKSLDKLSGLEEDTKAGFVLETDEDGNLKVETVEIKKDFDVQEDSEKLILTYQNDDKEFIFDKNNKTVTIKENGDIIKELNLNQTVTRGNLQIFSNSDDYSVEVATNGIDYLIIEWSESGRNAQVGETAVIHSKKGRIAYTFDYIRSDTGNYFDKAELQGHGKVGSNGGYRGDFLSVDESFNFIFTGDWYFYQNWKGYEGYFQVLDGILTYSDKIELQVMNKGLLLGQVQPFDGVISQVFAKGEATANSIGDYTYKKGYFRLENFTGADYQPILNSSAINFIQKNDEYSSNYLELSLNTIDELYLEKNESQNIVLLNYEDKKRSLLAFLSEVFTGETTEFDWIRFKPQNYLRLAFSQNDVNLNIEKGFINGIINIREGKKGNLIFKEQLSDDKVILATNVALNKLPTGEVVINKAE